MTAEVESMAYAGAVPWHGLGERVDELAERSAELMLRASGLEWEVERVPLVTKDSQQDAPGYATRRKSDHKVLGVVGPRYEVLQNSRAFEWFQPFVEKGEARFHTAGSLRGGAIVWVLAKLNKDPLVIAGEDVVEKFLLLSHSHDGSMSIRTGFTPTRVVCMNTLAMAHQGGGLVRVRHTRALYENLEALQQAVSTINERFEATAEVYRKLVNKDINQKDVKRFVHLVFDLPEPGGPAAGGEGQDGPQGGPQEPPQAASGQAECCPDLNGESGEQPEGPPPEELTHYQEKLVDDVLGRIEAGRGQDLKWVRGTWWAAYNGVTEYLNYQRGRSDSSRLCSLWFGDSAQISEKALVLAEKFADGRA